MGLGQRRIARRQRGGEERGERGERGGEERGEERGERGGEERGGVERGGEERGERGGVERGERGERGGVERGERGGVERGARGGVERGGEERGERGERGGVERGERGGVERGERGGVVRGARGGEERATRAGVERGVWADGRAPSGVPGGFRPMTNAANAWQKRGIHETAEGRMKMFDALRPELRRFLRESPIDWAVTPFYRSRAVERMTIASLKEQDAMELALAARRHYGADHPQAPRSRRP